MPYEKNVEGRVGYQMKRAQHALRSEMDGALRELGMTTAQYAALSALEAVPGVSGAELARRSFVTPQTMNQILFNLEKSALISRRAHPEHGRVLQAHLTDRGRKLVSEAHRMVEAIEKRMLSGLDENQRLELLKALRACAESLETTPGTTVAAHEE